MPFDAGAAKGQLELDTSKWTGSINKAENDLAGFQSEIKKTGEQVKRMAEVFAVTGIAINAAIGATIYNFAKFDKSLRVSTAITQTTMSEFDAMGKLAKRIAKELVIGADEAAKAYYYLGSTGLTAAEQLKSFEPVLKMSKAMVSDIGFTTEAFTDIMRGFNFEFSESQRVADVLTKTVIATNTTFAQLGEAMAYVAGIAKNTNNSLEDTAAVLGVLANVGIKGSMAGTSLRHALLHLMAPISELRKLLDEYNISIYTSTGTMKPFVQIIEELANMMKNVTEEERNMVFRIMFGERALSGQISIFNRGTESIRKFSEVLKNSQGVVDEVVQKQLAALSEKLKDTNIHFINLTYTIGNVFTRSLVAISERLSSFIDKVDQAIISHQRLTDTIIVSLTVFASLNLVIAAVSTTFVLLTKVFGTTTIGLMALGLKVGIITAAIALLVGDYVAAANETKRLQEQIKKLNETIDVMNIKTKNAQENWLSLISVSTKASRAYKEYEDLLKRRSELERDLLAAMKGASDEAFRGIYKKYGITFFDAFFGGREKLKAKIQENIHIVEEAMKVTESFFTNLLILSKQTTEEITPWIKEQENVLKKYIDTLEVEILEAMTNISQILSQMRAEGKAGTYDYIALTKAYEDLEKQWTDMMTPAEDLETELKLLNDLGVQTTAQRNIEVSKLKYLMTVYKDDANVVKDLQEQLDKLNQKEDEFTKMGITLTTVIKEQINAYEQLKQKAIELGDTFALAQIQMKIDDLNTQLLESMDLFVKWGIMSSQALQFQIDLFEKLKQKAIELNDSIALDEINNKLRQLYEMQGYKPDFQESLQDMYNDWDRNFNLMGDLAKSTWDGIGQGLHQLVSGIMRGELKKGADMWRIFGNIVLDVIADIIAQLIRALIVQTMLKAMGLAFPSLGGGGSPAGPGDIFASAQTGLNYVPATGLYQLHQGEKVIPTGKVNFDEKEFVIDLKIINAITPESIARGLTHTEPRETVINIIAADASKSGTIRQVIRRR